MDGTRIILFFKFYCIVHSIIQLYINSHYYFLKGTTFEEQEEKNWDNKLNLTKGTIGWSRNKKIYYDNLLR